MAFLGDNEHSSFLFPNSLQIKKLLETKIANISIVAICLMILVFIYIANIPMTYLKPLWTLLEVFLPNSVLHLLPDTTHKFQTCFLNFFIDMSNEKIELDTKTLRCEQIFYNIEHKIQEKFNLRSYRKILFEGKLRIIEKSKNKTWEKHLDDINDGRVLRFLNNNYLSFQNHLCFQLFVDGVTPFENSPEDLTPVYLVNLQIPYEHRYKQQNMSLVAMLSVNGEFDSQIFFDNLVERLNKTLASFRVILNGRCFLCEGFIVSIILDTVEREKIFKFSSGMFYLL